MRPVAGKFAAALFTVGIVGVGFLAIPTLAGSAAYAFGMARQVFAQAHRLAHVPAHHTTLLHANGEDVKVVQELLRHGSSRITMDGYAQAGTPAKRNAQGKVVAMLRETKKEEKLG